jgi:hypothetical protein
MQDKNIDPHPPMSSQQLLGILTHTCNYFILNTILGQAESMLDGDFGIPLSKSLGEKQP